MTTTKQKSLKRVVSLLAATLALFAVTASAQAQEIHLTGPLAGAPASGPVSWISCAWARSVTANSASATASTDTARFKNFCFVVVMPR
ncbi:MAG TPA: hypothetical protein VF294_17415, partial [Polyangiaceae bacterium]